MTASFDLIIILVAKYAIVIPVLLVAAEIVRRRVFARDLSEAALGGTLTIGLVKLGGALYSHQRPFTLLHIRPLITHVADNAFPSDHLAACGLAAVFLWPRNRIWSAVAIAAAVVLGFARVLAKLHWPADIVGGFTFGAVGGLLAIAALNHLWPRSHTR